MIREAIDDYKLESESVFRWDYLSINTCKFRKGKNKHNGLIKFHRRIIPSGVRGNKLSELLQIGEVFLNSIWLIIILRVTKNIQRWELYLCSTIATLTIIVDIYIPFI